MAQYIIDTNTSRVYAGNNFYMAVNYFKWACANGYSATFKEWNTSKGEYLTLRIHNC